jgi:hypothetical protein
LKDADRLIGGLSALFRYSARGEALPELSWSWSAANADRLELFVRPDRRPRELRAWRASSPTRDFREARWSQHRCERSREEFRCIEPLAPDRYSALYAEATFKDRGEPQFSLSTAICIADGSNHQPPDCLRFEEPPQRTASGTGRH